MKIYFIGQKGIPATSGGIERHVEELASRLARRGHEVFVYTRSHYTPANLKKYKGVNLISLPTIKTKHLDAFVHTFLATLHVLSQDADIIHYHAIGPATLLWIPRLFKRSAKVIFTFHCQDYLHQKWGVISRAYLRLGEKIGTAFAHQPITVSETLKKYSNKKYSNKSVYLPSGCPKINRINSGIGLKQWGVRKNQYILSVSRLVRHKGVHHLIEAYKKLHTNKKLVIVGDGAYTDGYTKELKRLAEGNDKIIFTGALSGLSLETLFSHAYLFVHPSEVEGLSVALLEAMAYGRALLVSDIAENKEVVKDFMPSFKSGSVPDLKRKLEFLIKNSRIISQLAKQAPRIIKSYNWDNIAHATEEVYRFSQNKRDAEIVLPARRVITARAK